MRPLLLLDNKDSFVWNLAQAFSVLGPRIDVVRSDQVTIDECVGRRPSAIVLSPGPGRPEGAGISVEVVRRLSGRIPILGVCLGHQAIGHAFGARIRRAPPCHGKPWRVLHEGGGLYANLENPLVACRYHSLVVDALPKQLVPDAWSPEGLLMGMRHRSHKTFGVQFHPESFRSSHGPHLLANFLRLL